MSHTLTTLLICQALISASLLVYSMNFALASRTHANAVLLNVLFCFIFIFWSRRELEGEFWIANEDIRMFGGGTCDSEPWLTAPRAVQYLGSWQCFGVL